MKENAKTRKSAAFKTFFKGLVEKMDKKMKEKAGSGCCCCRPSDKDKKSCCS
jgi:hypothetical protein